MHVVAVLLDDSLRPDGRRHGFGVLQHFLDIRILRKNINARFKHFHDVIVEKRVVSEAVDLTKLLWMEDYQSRRKTRQ